MTTLHQLEVALTQFVVQATQGANVQGRPIKIQAAPGWPPENALQEVGRIENHLCLIAIYDRRISKDSTRWSPKTVGMQVTAAGLTSSVSVVSIAAGGSAVIALGGTVKANDAVSCVLTNTGPIPHAQAADVVSAVATDTPSTMATKLAAKINADSVISTWVSAIASGADVTITNNSGHLLNIASYTGNNGVQVIELGRRLRQFQIAVWTRSEEEREAVGDPIESAIAGLQVNFGLLMPDGSSARVIYGSDHAFEDATLEDVLRRDFFLSVDYGITTQDYLYSVLAPIEQFATG